MNSLKMTKNICNKPLVKIICFVLLTLFVLVIDKYTNTFDISKIFSFNGFQFLVTLLSLFLLQARKPIAIPLLLIYFISSTVAVNYSLIGLKFNFSELNNIFINHEFIYTALKTFVSLKEILYAILIFISWLLVFFIVNTKCFYIKAFSKLKGLVVILSLLFVAGFFNYYKKGDFDAYPSHMLTAHNLINKFFLFAPIKQRIEPYSVTINNTFTPHIVLIIDESIRGDMLSLNGFNKNTTPFLKANKNYILNFGIAAASASSSHLSNLIIRNGIKPTDLPDRDNSTESNMPLSYYAKKAGFYTSIFDAQSNGINGGFRESDTKYVDKIIDYNELNSNGLPYRDLKLIDKLINTIDNHSKTFSYINKYGSHFYYDDSYPKNQRHFMPVQSSSTDENNINLRITNSYLNSIRWSVDYFWQSLIKKLKDRPVIIIYTSDHGQSFGAKSGDFKKYPPHSGNKVEHAIVPLWVYSTNTITEKIFAKYGLGFINNANKLSHYEIFPTILELLGYQKINDVNLSDLWQNNIFKANKNSNNFFITTRGSPRLNRAEKIPFNYPLQSSSP